MRASRAHRAKGRPVKFKIPFAGRFNAESLGDPSLRRLAQPFAQVPVYDQSFERFRDRRFVIWRNHNPGDAVDDRFGVAADICHDDR